MMIGTDIISPEDIIINLREKSVYVSNCAINLKIDTKQKGLFIHRKLLAQHNVIVLLHSQALIPFTSQCFLGDRDFLFEPSSLQGRITLFSYLMNHNTPSIFVRNESSKVGQIL